MLRSVINPFLLLPLTLSMNTFNVLSSEIKNNIDNVLEEKSNITFVDYKEIEEIYSLVEPGTIIYIYA